MYAVPTPTHSRNVKEKVNNPCTVETLYYPTNVQIYNS